jgi:hypothetical protein
MSTRKLILAKKNKQRDIDSQVVLNGMTLYEWN